MRILQKIFLQKTFEITGLYLFLQRCKDVQLMQIGKRFFIIIQPAVEHIEAIHQAFRIGRVVRLAKTEFKIVDPRLQRPAVDPLIRQLPKRLRG